MVCFHREVCLCRLHLCTSLCATFPRPAPCLPFCVVSNRQKMPSLCCFRSKEADPAPSSKRSRLTHRPQQSIPGPLHAPPPVLSTRTPQPLSQSHARTSTQRPQRRTLEASWPSSRPLINRAVTIQKPLASTPAILQCPSRDIGHRYPSSRKLARGSIHIQPASAPRQHCKKTETHVPASSPLNISAGMARSRPRNDGPQCRGETLALLEGRAPNRLSFNQRMSQPSTSAPPETALRQQTFLDDGTSSNSEIDLFHEDSGYSSTVLSPLKNKHHTSGSTTNQPLLIPPPIPSPTALTAPSTSSSTSSAIQHAPETRRAPALCDHRHCLRHKQSCLEHPRTPPSTRQSSYRRRRMSGEMSRRADADVWVKVGTEYESGSCGETLSRAMACRMSGAECG